MPKMEGGKGNRLCQPLSAVKQGCSKRVHIYVSIGQRPRMETVAKHLKWQIVAECLKWQTVAEHLKWQHRVTERTPKRKGNISQHFLRSWLLLLPQAHSLFLWK